ncbi:hypothetical protein K505DRAFT_382079, partial [Melanomma pulvis-pyrius CBS 109.77]
STYIGLQRRFRARACVTHKATCAPILRQQREVPIIGDRQWYIGCRSWNWSTQHTESHFIQQVSYKVDRVYLQQLLEHGLPNAETNTQGCNVVEPRTSRIKQCVIWNILIPNDIETIPYFVLIAFGTHSHIPPPPSIPGEKQLQSIKNILHPMLTPGVTRSQFLNSPQLAAYLASKGFRSIEDLSITFANKDRITRVIKHETLTRFPYGSGLEGVLFEWKTRHQNPETMQAYIRRITSSVSGNTIICFYNQQAKILLTQETFQMDMSFKRLRRPWSEVLIAVFDSKQSKPVLTLGRIITDTEKRDMYQLAISAFFEECSKRVQKRVEWYHLHGRGFKGITVDMDTKQMGGFGRYLQSIDPERRQWDWQLQSCVRFCYVHFMRGINTATAGEERSEYSAWGRMKALLNASTRNEYYELLDIIIATEQKASIQEWAKHKKGSVIAAGLVQCCSNIPILNWNLLESHSNAAEQAGQKSYRTGKSLPLLQAITAAMQMDLQDVREYDAYSKYGIRHNYRAASTISQRYFNNRARETSK